MGQDQQVREMVLSRVSKCAQCGVEYDLLDVNVLGHQQDLWFLMLTCSQCHQTVGVAAAANDTPRPSPRAANESVSRDDVGAVHDFLQDFDGDFRSLFDK